MQHNTTSLTVSLAAAVRLFFCRRGDLRMLSTSRDQPISAARFSQHQFIPHCVSVTCAQHSICYGNQALVPQQFLKRTANANAKMHWPYTCTHYHTNHSYLIVVSMNGSKSRFFFSRWRRTETFTDTLPTHRWSEDTQRFTRLFAQPTQHPLLPLCRLQ